MLKLRPAAFFMPSRISKIEAKRKSKTNLRCCGNPEQSRWTALFFNQNLLPSHSTIELYPPILLAGLSAEACPP